jgi:hypothetical protein
MGKGDCYDSILERKEKIDYIVEMMVLDKLQMKRKARQE